MRKLLVTLSGALTAGLAIFALTAQPAFALTDTTVRPSDIRPVSTAATGPPGWYREVTGSGFVNATDAKSYNGSGSLEFRVSDSSSYAEAALYKKLSSHRLADLLYNGLSYASWQTSDGPQAVSLQVGLDLDVTDTSTPWQGRLVFEPYLNTDFYGDPIGEDKWQTWLTLKEDAKWWMTWSAAATTAHGSNPCPQSAPCTVSEILQRFPNAGFNAGFGNPLSLKAGSGWSSFVGYADVPYVGDSTDAFWDFEPALPNTPSTPSSKDQCKDDGWKALMNADNQPFKNQGQCVSYVTSN